MTAPVVNDHEATTVGTADVLPDLAIRQLDAVVAGIDFVIPHRKAEVRAGRRLPAFLGIVLTMELEEPNHGATRS